MRLFAYLLFLVAVAFLKLPLVAQPLIETDKLSAKNDWNISGSLSYIEDRTGLTPEQVPEIKSSAWRMNKKPYTFNKGISQYGYWFRFRVKGGKTKSNIFFIELSNRGLNEAELFILNKNELISRGKTGDHYSFSLRPYAATCFTYPLSIAAGDTVTCYLYCNKKNENLNLKIRVLPQEIIKQKETRGSVFLGLFCGIFLMAFIVSIIMLVIFRDQLNFWYAVYIVLVVNLLLVYEGLDFQWFYPNHPFYASISRYIASSLTLGMMMYVMQLFCNQRVGNSRFYYAVEISKYFIFLFAPLTWFIYRNPAATELKQIHFTVFLLQQLGGMILIIACSVEKILQGYKPAAFYLSAVFLLLYSATSAIFLELGIINKNTDTPNLLQWSFVIEIVLISIGILYKYQLVKQKNGSLSKELADLKLSSIKDLLQTQYEEQARIAEDLHDLMGAKLAALKFKVLGLQAPDNQKKEITGVIDELSGSSRTIAHNLRPSELHHHDLSHVIEAYLQRLNKEQSIHFEFIQSGIPESITPEFEIPLYKIIIELVTNILKHSGASEAVVQFSFHEYRFELLVEDNGRGLEKGKEEGMGMKNIRKRVQQLNGTLHIDSCPGNTTFILSFEYKK
ncbi:MAG: 7TM diverse intracellular signaling domain-containing protein [Chitinophagaceae bacterium]|jgi:signal transduction histidine kinase